MNPPEGFHLTPYERIVWDITADGKPHSIEEIANALDPDDLISNESITTLVYKLRIKLNVIRQGIIMQGPPKKGYVRFLQLPVPR